MNTQYEVRHPEAEPKESDGARHPEAEPKDLLEWDIRITEELQTAAKIEVPDPEDTLKTIVKYVPMQLEHQSAIYEGGAYAVYVIATNVVTGETREGWVSCGSFLPFSFSILPLDSGRSIAMPEREPKRYVSDVTLYVRDGNDAVCLGDRTIEVNHPLDVNGWKIYQTGYEEQLGAASRYSIFEVVRDPWLPLVYLGIFMMLAGALSLFLTSKPKSYQQ
ncbi:MAG: cytochrome c biogenesis protein ResB [Bacteroidales bacterium]|nr:cytochrome c biogenesis protein ResB [Bacteroidales bacterium]